MKKSFILIILIAVAMAGYPAKTPFLQAQLFYSKFYTPADGPYLETYLSVVGNSVSFVKNETGKFQGTIEITMIFSKDGKVANFDKYELLSPEVDDTTTINFNFLDQQRFTLPNGIYDYEIQIRDKNSLAEPFKTNQTVEINFAEGVISISGIELLQKYSKSTETSIITKSGYDLVPYVYTFFPDKVNSLKFYTEIYNTQKVLGEEGKFLVNYFIESYETQRQLADFVRFKRETAKVVNIILAEFEISKLPSGNYNLVIEVRDTKNEIITNNKVFFQRSNPDVEANYSDFAGISTENSFVTKITNRDSLMEYIRSLDPISSEIEKTYVKYQIEKANAGLDVMQRYFLNFWLNRDEKNPELAWKQYLTNVELVDEQFGYPGKKGGRKGYDTDMGRIYLKYGPPNTITDRPYDASGSGMTINNGGSSTASAGSVPYQIWHYYTLNNQRNKKFVFANPNLAAYDYVLIHSNVPGEINNENWQSELARIKEGLSLPGDDKYKGQSGEFYDNPR